jgi:sulfane dehydrogenase subunit SoxC
MDDAIVAYSQNGEPVRPEQGFPLRLLVPGCAGDDSVKWLRSIQVVDRPYMTPRDCSAAAPRKDGVSTLLDPQLGAKSIITFPSGEQQLPSRGSYEVSGLAWSGAGAVRRVEVSTDGGRTWKDAELQQPVHRKAWTRFRFPWNWNGEEAMLQSRCTDEGGEVQPTLAEIARIWGTTVEEWKRGNWTKAPTFFNPIQPWHVTRDGRVHNALFL